MKVYICRLSFLPSNQKALCKVDYEEKPIILLEESLKQNLVFHPKRYGLGYISLEFGDLVLDRSNSLLAGKIGKKKGLKKIDYQEGRFDEVEDVSHPYVNFIWDRSQQVIIIEKNSSVFSDVELFIRSIEYHFNNLIAKYEIRVNLIPITKKLEFWNVFKEYEAIYEIKFELLMPNFLGRTNRTVKEILKQYCDDYNASSVNVAIKNSDGNLSVNKDDESILKIVRWITDGGGSWTAVAKKTRSKFGRKTIIQSSQNIIYQDISTETNMRSPENIKKTIKKISITYKIEDEEES